jgi:ribosomal protein S12 methylthiotransferase accessory factor
VTLTVADLDPQEAPSLDEAVTRARRVVGSATGIVRRVVFEDCPADGPRAYIVRTDPSDAGPPLGTEALNRGSAVSFERNRAIMKAIGESIERYCGAYAGAASVVGSARQLPHAIAPARFELFAPEQHDDPGFSLERFDDDSIIRWVQGTSLVTGDLALVPASMVYVPYQAVDGEAQICDRISTGLACAHSRAAALGKGILEVVERDALMIAWHNRLASPRIRLGRIDDPLVHACLGMFEGMAIQLDAFCLTLDIPVPVVLAVAHSSVDATPHTVVGLGTACDPVRAVALALEEVALGLWGVRVMAANRAAGDFDFETLDGRGTAYAARPELAACLDFLGKGSDVDLDDLPRVAPGDPRQQLQGLIERVTSVGLEPVGVDVTTEDIDEVGFKVCRVVIPGMRPLDIKHSRRHLGGPRLYQVPVSLGRLTRPHRRGELNQDPHPFP